MISKKVKDGRSGSALGGVLPKGHCQLSEQRAAVRESVVGTSVPNLT
jgi:hypothetical protein